MRERYSTECKFPLSGAGELESTFGLELSYKDEFRQCHVSHELQVSWSPELCQRPRWEDVGRWWMRKVETSMYLQPWAGPLGGQELVGFAHSPCAWY